MAAENFEACLAFVLRHEGGYVDHPRDPGGATNMGITIATFRAWRKDPKLTKNHLKQLTKEEVGAIYEVNYWNAVHADELPSGIDHMTFDQAVNAGVRRSALHLQTAIGMTGKDLDGAIGPRTLAAVRAQEAGELISTLGDAHRRHYKSLSTFPTFGKGWLNRLNARLALARKLVDKIEQVGKDDKVDVKKLKRHARTLSDDDDEILAAKED